MIVPIANESVLVLIDLQIDSVASIRTLEPEVLISNALAVAQIAFLHEMPVVISLGKKTGSGGGMVPALDQFTSSQRSSSPVRVQRSVANAWDSTEFVDAITRTGRRKLIIAGVAVDVGVLFCALSAVAAGFEVWVVLDATGTTDRVVEEIAWMRLIQASVIPIGCASLALGLMKDFASPLAPATIAALRSRTSEGHDPFPKVAKEPVYAETP